SFPPFRIKKGLHGLHIQRMRTASSSLQGRCSRENRDGAARCNPRASDAHRLGYSALEVPAAVQKRSSSLRQNHKTAVRNGISRRRLFSRRYYKTISNNENGP